MQPKPKYRIQRAAICLALGLCAGQAEATIVTYQVGNGGLETYGNVTIDGSTYYSALVGGISMTEVGGPVAGVPQNYVTVCTDIQGTLYLGENYNYNAPATGFLNQTGVAPAWGADNGPGSAVSDPTSAAKAVQNAAYLFYTYGGANIFSTGITGLSGTSFTYNSQNFTATAVQEEAALQLAIWYALYDTTASGNVLATGSRFTASGDTTATDLALMWLNGLTGAYNYNGYLFYPNPPTGANNGNGQGDPPQELMLAEASSSLTTPVPEPSTMIAGGLLLMPFGASVVRILRKNKS
jgi:hypothetical protein